MGNYINSIQEIKFNFLKKKINLKNFLFHNIIDNENNIIIGIYKNSKKSNTISSECICIGNNINKLKFGMFHNFNIHKIVELYFENNIKVKFIQESNNEIKLILDDNENIKIEKYINKNIIKNLKPINNNSEYLDLIFNII
jgi:hypothetical protein